LHEVCNTQDALSLESLSAGFNIFVELWRNAAEEVGAGNNKFTRSCVADVVLKCLGQIITASDSEWNQHVASNQRLSALTKQIPLQLFKTLPSRFIEQEAVSIVKESTKQCTHAPMTAAVASILASKLLKDESRRALSLLRQHMATTGALHTRRHYSEHPDDT
jgi:hypothetical protein